MSDIIQLLPDHVANQIAAGEVVQRPASVVKELLENAIDAEATDIKLIIKDAGKTLVQVIDNGKGMSTTDARLSFERHATSKIRNAEDLFKLNTKGFRGEALASIAAIAHVELKTKQENQELGTQLIIEGSEVKSQNVAVTPKGTSVAVKNLFFNIPARRNFLKSNTVELRHITDEFHRVALSHPDIAFSMFHNGSQLFDLQASNYRKRIVNIFGSKTNEKLVPVTEDTEVLKVNGFVGKPQFSRKTRSEQFFFVNNRFVKSPYLNHAINASFEGLLKDGYYPSYFLHLTVDPQSVDINIHPTKTEVKFDDEHTLYAILRSAVKHSLGQFNVAPILDFNSSTHLDTPYSYKDKDGKTPTIEVDRSFNPFQDEVGTPAKIMHTSSNFNPSKHSKNSSGWESLYVGLNSETKNSDTVLNFESEPKPLEVFSENEVQQESAYFQLRSKYIVSTLKSGMLIIDQNRAHQRILYEDFLKQLTVKEATTQQLLFPVKLNFSSSDIKVLQDLEKDLAATGFVFSDFLEDEVVVSGIPVGVSEGQITAVFEQLINAIENDVPDQNFSTSDILAKSMAKSLAIKNGQALSNTEQEYILNRLFACKEPTVSPTNKTTFITLPLDDVEKKFN